MEQDYFYIYNKLNRCWWWILGGPQWVLCLKETKEIFDAATAKFLQACILFNFFLTDEIAFLTCWNSYESFQAIVFWIRNNTQYELYHLGFVTLWSVLDTSALHLLFRLEFERTSKSTKKLHYLHWINHLTLLLTGFLTNDYSRWGSLGPQSYF